MKLDAIICVIDCVNFKVIGIDADVATAIELGSLRTLHGADCGKSCCLYVLLGLRRHKFHSKVADQVHRSHTVEQARGTVNVGAKQSCLERHASLIFLTVLFATMYTCASSCGDVQLLSDSRQLDNVIDSVCELNPETPRIKTDQGYVNVNLCIGMDSAGTLYQHEQLDIPASVSET